MYWILSSNIVSLSRYHTPIIHVPRLDLIMNYITTTKENIHHKQHYRWPGQSLSLSSQSLSYSHYFHNYKWQLYLFRILHSEGGYLVLQVTKVFYFWISFISFIKIVMYLALQHRLFCTYIENNVLHFILQIWHSILHVVLQECYAHLPKKIIEISKDEVMAATTIVPKISMDNI